MTQCIVLAGQPSYPPEKVASVAILPGYLLADGAGGAAGKVLPHATADGNARPAFAIEALVPSLASSQTAPIDIPYAIGDSVRWVLAHRGDEIYALLAASQTIVEGDDLVSAGDGTLKKATAATAVTVGISTQIVAKAAEAVTTTGAVARIRVRAV